MEDFNEENNEIKEKKSGLIIIVIIILVLIILGLSGFIVYDKFIKKDKESSNINNTIEDKEKENTNENLASDYETAIKNSVSNYKEKIYNDFTNDEWIVYAISQASNTSNKINHDVVSSKTSTDIVLYALYQTGLSDEEIEKLGPDKDLFKNSITNTGRYYMYNLSSVKEQIINLYGNDGNIFNNSFSKYGCKTDNKFCGYVVYSNKLNYVFEDFSGSTAGGVARYILNATNEDNLYKVEYYDYVLELGDEYAIKTSDGKTVFKYNYETLDDDYKKYSDSFNKYIAVFEKIDGIYKYKETIAGDKGSIYTK